jgi:hypothetical protein
MQLYNPFMPYRYLHPRASGLIAYKGGGGASAAEVDASVAGGVTAVNENTDAGFADAAVVGEEIKSNQGTMLDNQANLSTGQSDIRADIAAIPQTSVTTQVVDTSGIENRIGSLEGTTNTGFADVGGRLDTVNSTMNTGFSNVQGSVDTGFSDMNQSFNDVAEGQTGIQNSVSDLSGNMTDRFDTVDSTLDTGFAGVNENVNTQFNAQNQNLTDLSANVLGGQTSLQSYLEGMSDRSDTYYGGLAEGQAGIMGGIGGMQTGLNDFRENYDANTTLANQTRAELLDTVTGGFNQTRETISDSFNDTSRDINNVSGQVDEQARRAAASAPVSAQEFTQTIRELASGLDAGTREQAAAQNDVVQRLDTVKQVLTTQGENLPDDIRQQYTQLAQAFDQNGKLVRESIDAQGVTTRRAMDNQSNVLLANFDQQGQMLGQNMFNVNSLLKQMDQLGYTGQGLQPGTLAPQQLVNRRAAIDSGLMERQDPYFNTFG